MVDSMAIADNKRTRLGVVLLWPVLGALGFVWLGLALAWGGAWGRWAGSIGEWMGWDWLGVAVALGWAAFCGVGLGWVTRRWGERAFVIAAVGVSLAAGLGWAWATRGMGRWPMDSGYFRWFLDRLAAGGYTRETLGALSGSYDYGAWASRALPFLYPLRLWAGAERFCLAVQVAQAVLGATVVGLAWRTTKLLFGNSAARWTAIALVSMPSWGLQAIGLNHQVWAVSGMAAGMWLLAEWMYGGGGAWKRAGLCAGAVLLASVWMMEGSAGGLYRLFVILLAGLELLRKGGRRWLAVAAVVCLVLLPHAFERWLDRPWAEIREGGNPVSMNGGSLAFMTRGWDLTWGGEYSDTLQNLDIQTPPGGKDGFFRRFLASQCAWNGRTLVTKLFPTKLAKFMLAGYASLAEEVLWANGAERTARVARGARVGWFLLLYAPLMLWGLQRLAGRLEDGRASWCLLPVALFAAAVMFAGETSPRYSMPVQPLLLAAGVAGLVGGGGGGAERKTAWHLFAAGLMLVIGAYLVFSGALLGLRGTWKNAGFVDMRSATLTGGAAAADPLLAPFEVVFPDGRGEVAWPGLGGNGIAYLRGASWRDHGQVMVAWTPGEEKAITLPARLEMDWAADGRRTLTLRRIGSEGAVNVGYVSIGF